MYNLVIGISFLVILAYLSLYSKNDKFNVSLEYTLDGESQEIDSDKCKEVKSGGLHIIMHHIKGVANIFSPEIKIDA